jgi:hypothetical protein
MATRLFICIVLAIIASAALVMVTINSMDVKAPEVIAGFAIEAIGILITVGFVDLLLERDRRHERAKTLAWNVIHATDHAVWVWQGGSRRLDLGELVSLIDLVDDRDPRPVSTENLLLQLGDTCQNILQTQDPAVASGSIFAEGFEALAHLSYFRDSPTSPVANHEIQRHLKEGISNLLVAVGVKVEVASMRNSRNVETTRDPSESAQRFRLTGERATPAGGLTALTS